jgi:exopolysaccharide biosynthesis polyprenyl glycosylphosphotransferase
LNRSGPQLSTELAELTPETERANGAGHLKMGLQRGAPRILRRHLVRAAVRVVVLAVADLAAFWVVRALYRLVGERDLFGAALAGPVRSLYPNAAFEGWQFAAALLIALVVTGNYGAGDLRRDPTRLLLGCALAAALPLWVPLWNLGLALVAVQYAATTVTVWAAVAVFRLALEAVDARVIGRQPASSPTILVGPSADCRGIRGRRAFAHRSEHAVLGFVDMASPPHPESLGHVAALPGIIHERRVETVVLCGALDRDTLREVVDHAVTAGCHIYAVPPVFEVPGVSPAVVWKRGQPLVELAGQTLRAQQFLVKRALDVAGAALGLVLLSPLLAVLAAAIKLDSKGAVVFTQRRAGIGGRPFRMWKLRTMRVGADGLKEALAHLNHSGDPRLFKIMEDPRVTGLGGWLRRWSLDELPQLWNVLKGEMSLVGPRPFFESDLEYYEIHHFGRLGAKPGITGLWQVSGRSDIVDFEEVVALDTRYVREWSLLLDLEILARTVPALVRRRGAR